MHHRSVVVTPMHRTVPDLAWCLEIHLFIYSLYYLFTISPFTRRHLHRGGVIFQSPIATDSHVSKGTDAIRMRAINGILWSLLYPLISSILDFFHFLALSLSSSSLFSHHGSHMKVLILLWILLKKVTFDRQYPVQILWNRICWFNYFSHKKVFQF